MKIKKRLLSVVLASILALSLLGSAFAVDGAQASADMSGQIVILHTNDVHSRVAESGSPGYAGVAAAKAHYEGLGAEVLLFDAGDTLHGLPIANLSQGSNIVDIMNAVGYDLMIPGNHDFNYTASRLIELADSMNFPLICANYTDDETGEPVFDPVAIFESDVTGMKIGVVGITTPETATKSSPLNTEGYSFNGDLLAEIVQECIDILKEAECDYIIGLGHLGIDNESAPNGWRSADVISEVSGFDLFIDGHSHSTLDDIKEAGFETVKDKDGNDVPLTSTGNYLNNIGMVTINGDEVTVGYADMTNIEPDAEIAGMIKNVNDGLKPVLDTIVANTAVELNAARAPGNRTNETNLGNLCTDALRYVSGADVSLTNGGGIRQPYNLDFLPVEHTDPNGAYYIEGAKAGDISVGDLNAVYPFGNLVVTIDIKGSDLLAALEHGTKTYPEANGGFPQVSGLSFELYAFEDENRVHNVKVDGEPLDLDKTYSLATNDFTQIGGDGYDMLAGYSVTGYYGGLDEALIKYVEEELGGVVGQEYASPAGRMIIRELYPDVASTDWFYDAVKFVTDNKIMSGTGTGFAPLSTMTRGMLVTMLWREAGSPEPENNASEYFYDITNNDDWYTKAAAWAYENDITTGVENVAEGEKNSFNFAGTLSRQQMATFIYRYRLIMGEDSVVGGDSSIYDDFIDVGDISDWALEGAAFCYDYGIMQGKPGSLFDPNGDANRAQGATVMMNFMNLDLEQEEAA